MRALAPSSVGPRPLLPLQRSGPRPRRPRLSRPPRSRRERFSSPALVFRSSISRRHGQCLATCRLQLPRCRRPTSRRACGPTRRRHAEPAPAASLAALPPLPTSGAVPEVPRQRACHIELLRSRRVPRPRPQPLPWLVRPLSRRPCLPPAHVPPRTIRGSSRPRPRKSFSSIRARVHSLDCGSRRPGRGRASSAYWSRSTSAFRLSRFRYSAAHYSPPQHR